jgi:hypothetical protein
LTFIATLGLLPLAFLSSATTLRAILLEFLLIVIRIAVFALPMVKIILSCVSREIYGLGPSLEKTTRLLRNTMSTAVTAIVFTYIRRFS